MRKVTTEREPLSVLSQVQLNTQVDHEENLPENNVNKSSLPPMDLEELKYQSQKIITSRKEKTDKTAKKVEKNKHKTDFILQETRTNIVMTLTGTCVFNENELVQQRNKDYNEYITTKANLIAKDDKYTLVLEPFTKSTAIQVNLNVSRAEGTQVELQSTQNTQKKLTTVERVIKHVKDEYKSLLETPGCLFPLPSEPTYSTAKIAQKQLKTQFKMVERILVYNLHKEQLIKYKEKPKNSESQDNHIAFSGMLSEINDENKSIGTVSTKSKVSRLTKKSALRRCSRIGSVKKSSQIDEDQDTICYNASMEKLLEFKTNSTNSGIITRQVRFCKTLPDLFIAAYDQESTGIVKLWNSMNPEYPEKTIFYYCTVTAVAFSSCALVAAIGLANGQVDIVDFSLPVKNATLYSSLAVKDENCPIFAIVDFNWVTSLPNKIKVISLSNFGLVSEWIVKDNTLQHNALLNLKGITTSSLSFATSSSLDYLIAGVGIIYKCSLTYDGNYLARFKIQSHHEFTYITKIRCSSFSNNIVLVSTSDGTIDVVDIEHEKQPQFTLFGVEQMRNESIADACWSKTSPLHVVGVSSLNLVYLWDVSIDHSKPVCYLKLDQSLNFTTISFHVKENAIIAGAANGSTILCKIYDNVMDNQRIHLNEQYKTACITKQKNILSDILSDTAKIGFSLGSV